MGCPHSRSGSRCNHGLTSFTILGITKRKEIDNESCWFSSKLQGFWRVCFDISVVCGMLPHSLVKNKGGYYG